MKRIGLLSDTHGYWDSKYEKYFSECDEIWHAGDIGTVEVAEKLAAIKPLLSEEVFLHVHLSFSFRDTPTY